MILGLSILVTEYLYREEHPLHSEITFFSFCSKIFSFGGVSEIFLSESVNCSASDWLGKNFVTLQNCPKQSKNRYLINSLMTEFMSYRNQSISLLTCFHIKRTFVIKELNCCRNEKVQLKKGTRAFSVGSQTCGWNRLCQILILAKSNPIIP